MAYQIYVTDEAKRNSVILDAFVDGEDEVRLFMFKNSDLTARERNAFMGLLDLHGIADYIEKGINITVMKR